MKICRNRLKKPLYVALLLSVLVFLCTGCGEREKSQMLYREKGIQLMENGKYDKALVEFQNALDCALGEVEDVEADICFYKAECLYYTGDVQGAMDTYSAIIAYNEDPRAYFLRGNLYYSLGNEQNALLDYTAAIEKNPKEYEAYIGVYEALAAHGKVGEAESYLKQALDIKGNKAYDKMQKGRICFMLGDTTQALSLMEEAIKEKETDAYFYMAEIQEAIGDSQKAQENVTNYIESGKLDSYHLFEVANRQLAKGHYEMAIECLNQALELENMPNKQMIMKTLVIAHEQNRDFETAKKLMAEYIENYPDDVDALREFTFLETR